MIAKFSEAIHLLVRHLGLLAAIVLTVELPINVLLNYLSNNVDLDPSDAVRLAMLAEGIFSPIYVGALIYALFEIKSGRHVTYKEALAVGFKKWGPLFAARFVVGFLIWTRPWFSKARAQPAPERGARSSRQAGAGRYSGPRYCSSSSSCRCRLPFRCRWPSSNR